ncbi:MAG: UDP-N-acetylmuramoyl-L-alanine--D-glutamate ligase [Oscillospiraceae bacterium]|nr:UDP-N-acetylmuramoyl-L-alanine--D-glutamate ligase [Oscillospiraceae bacterium]MDY4192384.1 UDP-N-acetylmuramoyl-L-alanine--D-glutamate ligase [Oscillospiraceae bacterium]
MESSEQFFARLKDKKVAFIGVGVTNTDCIRMFARKGISTAVLDKKSRAAMGALADELEALGVRLVLGEDYLSHLEDYDVVYRAPGVYYNRPELTALRKSGRVLTSEMESFFRLCPCPSYAVTGSDGKTTTTTLIAEMLAAEGRTVHKGGNIGRALLPVVEQVTPRDRAVVELSSFQLISMRQSPDVAVVTNVAPNHLDVHGTMEEYISAKENLLRHQDGFSRAVLNFDNDITQGMEDLVRGELLWFSRRGPVEQGAFLGEDGVIRVSLRGTVTEVMHRDEIRLPGDHNVENYLAAIAAVWGEVSPDAIRRVARTFAGVEHRMELVRELGGVRWYNDSIGTSPTRTMAGLRCFDRKIILIAGGYDKKIPFEPLAPMLVEKVKLLILTGTAAAPKIYAALTSCPSFREGEPRVLWAKDMEEAVAMARENAKQGDIVSLSPACASFDLYRNFEERGEHFKSLVKEMK